MKKKKKRKKKKIGSGQVLLVVMMEIKIWKARKYDFSYHGWLLRIKEIEKKKNE